MLARQISILPMSQEWQTWHVHARAMDVENGPHARQIVTNAVVASWIIICAHTYPVATLAYIQCIKIVMITTKQLECPLASWDTILFVIRSDTYIDKRSNIAVIERVVVLPGLLF
jgi:hypothetical protein